MAAHQMALNVQQELRALPGNNRCVDCQAPYPQWATVSYGTFMCLECSGRHRGLGVHISFVRSVTMDSWTDQQIRAMQLGGNERFRSEFKKAGVPDSLSINQKYNTPQAETYRNNISALSKGQPPATLPMWSNSQMQSGSSSSSGSSNGAGDTRGVEALKGESEADYIARQMRLKEEARARMKAKFGQNGMQGIGSNGSSFSSSSSHQSSATDDLTSSFGSAFSFVSSSVASAANSVREKDLGSTISSGWSTVQNKLQDPNLTDNVKSTASSGWAVLSSGASSIFQTAQSLYSEGINPTGGTNTGPGSNPAFPRTNPSIDRKSSYDSYTADQAENSNRKEHSADDWLNAQLNQPKDTRPSYSRTTSQASTLSSSGSVSTMPSAPPSSSGVSLTNSLAGAGSASTSSPPPAPVSKRSSSPSPSPPKSEEKKKDVDFFGEFGM